MRDSTNINQLKTHLSCDNNTAKRFLALMYIHRERASVLDTSRPLDSVLDRLIKGLVRRIHNRESATSLYHAVVRSKPIFNGWKSRDCHSVLQYLEDAVVHQGVFPSDNYNDSQSELLDMLRIVGGDDVADRVEERSRRLSVVNVEVFENTVAQTVERAFWDSAKEKVQQGDLNPLYDVLHNVRRCVSTLLAAAPLARDQWEDRFDPKWIQERGNAGHLSRGDVGNLVVYLADQVGRMQAPADDETVIPWVEVVRKRAEETDALAEYLPDVVFVVRDAIRYLRLVYHRVVELSDNRKKEQ
jgi:uncharacterized protein YfkK (UPF0435 family)